MCVWNTDGWEKQTSKQLQIPAGRVAAPLADTRVQFHQDQTHLLAVHETQIAVYEAPKLESPKQVYFFSNYLYLRGTLYMLPSLCDVEVAKWANRAGQVTCQNMYILVWVGLTETLFVQYYL